MKENVDYVCLPKVIVNDLLNSGNTIKATVYVTKRYFFILAHKVENSVAVVGKNFYNVEYVKNLGNTIADMQPGLFELEMVEQIPSEYVIPFSNFEKFEVKVGSWIFGGLSFKIRGKRLQSASVGNKEKRQQLKDFCSDIPR